VFTARYGLGFYIKQSALRLLKVNAHIWGRVEVQAEFWWGNLRERDHLQNPGLNGRAILNGSSVSGLWGHGLDRSGSGQGQVAGTCKCSNELSGSIVCREFID
jgi:hypothetical protein